MPALKFIKLSDLSDLSQAIQTYINSRINEKPDIDTIYPVGSIYTSINNTNPSSFLGGTWVAVDIFVSGSSDVTTYSFKRTA